MSVYVDPLFEYGGSKSFRWERSCHLYADTLDELHAFAERIGMRREWYQSKLALPHYDLNERRRAAAVRAGAVEHSRREMVGFMRSRRSLVVSDMRSWLNIPGAVVGAIWVDGEKYDSVDAFGQAVDADVDLFSHALTGKPSVEVAR